MSFELTACIFVVPLMSSFTSIVHHWTSNTGLSVICQSKLRTFDVLCIIIQLSHYVSANRCTPGFRRRFKGSWEITTTY